MTDTRKKSRRPVRAAGGIVVRYGPEPLFAVVQMRKFDTWVLPKGKLDRGETALQAARREVIEETGHEVSVHEFIGTLAYEVGGRPKIVQFWRMQALDDAPAYTLMNDVKDVAWLPLGQALGRLTHLREREFLRGVGPHAATATASSPPDFIAAADARPAGDLKKRWGREIADFACTWLRRIRSARAQG